MKRNFILAKCLIYILFIYIINAFTSPAYGMEAEKTVLFISSYHPSYFTVPKQIEGMKSVFKSKGVNIDMEFMDTKRMDTKENKELFYQLLKYKLQNLKQYDAVLLGDDSALQFAMDFKDSLFKDLPIIFFCVNDLERAKMAAQNKNITGIVEAISLKENIEIARKFNGKAKKVIAIVDNTVTGKGSKQQFYQFRDEFKDLSFEDINISDYTFSEVREVLEKVQDDTTLLFLGMSQDKTGQTMSIDGVVNIIKSHTNVPVYTPFVDDSVEGLLGGKVVSYFEQGRMAADMAMKVFNGISIESIELVKESPNKYIFDHNIIKKYGIDEKLIPVNSILTNKKPTFYEENKNLILIVISVMALLIAGIVVMVIDNIKRRAAERMLKESNEELTALYEELTATEEELRDQYEEVQEYTEKLESLEQKYEIAIKGTNSAVWEVDLETNAIYFSNEISSILETSLSEKEDINKVVEEFIIPEDRHIFYNELLEITRDTTKEIYCQMRIKDKIGNLKWILLSGKGISDSQGGLKSISGIVLDITKIKEQEEYIQYLAYHDDLTCLPNRTYFMNKLTEELGRDKQGAVMLLDLDNFKEINDILGHTYGDIVLKEVAKQLDNIADQKAFISRFGGDEFLILIADEENPSIIEEYAEKVSKAFKKTLIIKGEEIHISYSMGITRYPYDSNDVNQLIMNADTAMYRVKNSGKNNYMFFNNEMIEKLKEKANIEMVLREALKNDGFILTYQPQVHVKTGEVIGFEALLRLKESNIPPNLFIPVAEETGLIIDLGNWVTREAIRQITIWRDSGLKLKPIAINFSTKQLRDETYLSFLERTLKENAVDPKYLEIEITESILLERTEETIDFLNKLKSKGVRIALDDFGTGYSSLSYLTFIPVDKIKLDKSLNDKFLEIENIKVMDSLISLAHSLNLQVTAEGIEEVDQYRRLKIGGCDYIQGYIFSKPLKAEDIEKIYDFNFLKNLDI